MGRKLSKGDPCCREMVDAIREILGFGPLYAADPTTNRYLSKQMESSIGDGNRKTNTANGSI